MWSTAFSQMIHKVQLSKLNFMSVIFNTSLAKLKLIQLNI